jgi:pimeloyl-ACP methyl ester carboxylesterase
VVPGPDCGLAGCGRSEATSTGNDLDGAIADIEALIAVSGLDRPVLIGSSLGAAFAVETALKSPELVSGVVSADGPAFWPSQGMESSECARMIVPDRGQGRRHCQDRCWPPRSGEDRSLGRGRLSADGRHGEPSADLVTLRGAELGEELESLLPV